MIVLALVLGLLDVSGAVQLWHVYLLAALLGVASALDVPVRQSFVVEMVGGADLPNAVSLNSATFNTARIVGPAVAGVMIAAVGTGWVFLVNAALTLAVIAGLLLMRLDELHRSPPAGRSPGQLREGLRYVRTRPDLVLPMLLVFVVGTFGLNFQLTMALMAREVFGRGAAAYGLLSTAIAVGSLAGALASTRRTTRPRQRMLLTAALVFGLLEVVVGLMPTYGALVVSLVPIGAAALTFTIAANSLGAARHGAVGARAGDGALPDVLHGRDAPRRAADRGAVRRASGRARASSGAGRSVCWPRSCSAWSSPGAAGSGWPSRWPRCRTRTCPGSPADATQRPRRVRPRTGRVTAVLSPAESRRTVG